MLKRVCPIVFVVIAVMAYSCTRRVESSYDSIRLVDDLVNDSLPSLQRMAKDACKPSGSIFLVGEPLQCLSLSEKMMNSDEFDNVDARMVSDGLPDFSGETIVSVLDFANFPYDTLALTEDGRLALREIAVRHALAAIDSSANCKVLILCSPQLAEQGGDDVSDFFEKIGCDMPVIYSQDTAFSYTQACYRILRERNMFTHNIAYPAARILMTIESLINPPFSSVSFEENLLPDYFVDTVGVFAPNTFVSYAQNKHKP